MSGDRKNQSNAASEAAHRGAMAPPKKLKRPELPEPQALVPINGRLVARPQSPVPTFSTPVPPRSIRSTSFIELPPEISVRLYPKANIDFVDKKGFGFASYSEIAKSSNTKVRTQLFFHASDYRTPETLASKQANRPHIIQIATVPPDEGEVYVPVARRDKSEAREAIYYVLGENARGPCIVSWTPVLEYNEYLDRMAKSYNDALLAAVNTPTYSLYINKPRSGGIVCNNATKSYEEQISWEETLAWVGNNMFCDDLVDAYVKGLNTNPSSRFRWQRHEISFDEQTGDWTSHGAVDCESPVQEPESDSEAASGKAGAVAA